MIIDSHCHLNYEPIFNQLEEVIARAQKKNVKFFLTISTEDKAFKTILEIIKKHKPVYASYGIHPHEAKSHLHIKCEDILKKTNYDKKIIGIGETGLDFYYNHSKENDQIKLFKEHIFASQESKLPLIVHTRSAEDKTIEILKNEIKRKNFKILIHCFTGTKKFAHELLDLGAYISASGVVTFKKSLDLANTFKGIPNDRILVETDSPYLSPAPHRGKSNEPSHIVHTVDFLSKLKNIDLNDFSNITSNNFINLFGQLI